MTVTMELGSVPLFLHINQQMI